MIYTEIAFFILLSMYSAYLLFIATSNLRRIKPRTEASLKQASVSVIIAARNEANNIERLFDSLASQCSIDPDNTELIFVNDHSTDDTLVLAQKQAQRLSFKYRILDLPNGLNGKKQAIQFALSKSECEYIITSDADCVFHKNWIQSTLSECQSRNLELLSGPVFIDSNSFFANLQSLEFTPIMSVTAHLFDSNNANMCNGANLCYKRQTFLELGAYDTNATTPSGDDIYLMQKIQQVYPDKLGFTQSKEALVMCEAASSFKAFFEQRIRWASKWKITDGKNGFLAPMVFLFHLVFFCGLIYSIINPATILWSGILIKFAVELFMIASFRSVYGLRTQFFAFLALSASYSLYVVYFAIISQVKKRYVWKGRDLAVS